MKAIWGKQNKTKKWKKEKSKFSRFAELQIVIWRKRKHEEKCKPDQGEEGARRPV